MPDRHHLLTVSAGMPWSFAEQLLSSLERVLEDLGATEVRAESEVDGLVLTAELPGEPFAAGGRSEVLVRS